METILTKVFEYQTRKDTQIVWRCFGCHKTISLPEKFSFSYCGNCGSKVLEKINVEVDF